LDTLVVALRVALSLGVVLALLWVLQRKVAKSALGKGARSRRASTVTVVGRQGIGGKASVVVVDVEGQRLVLGVSESQVSVLAAAEAPAPSLELVTAPTPIAAATTGEAAPTTSAPAFVDVLAAHAEPGRIEEAVLLRPRTRAARSARPTTAPTSQQLQGSILSRDTWRQAAAAVRSRRAG